MRVCVEYTLRIVSHCPRHPSFVGPRMRKYSVFLQGFCWRTNWLQRWIVFFLIKLHHAQWFEVLQGFWHRRRLSTFACVVWNDDPPACCQGGGNPAEPKTRAGNHSMQKGPCSLQLRLRRYLYQSFVWSDPSSSMVLVLDELVSSLWTFNRPDLRGQSDVVSRR